ncbi:hypothetical protein BD779DRAFT_1477239 [Infundibulicybe gibba]|nr:hypothetical protein BD779DRAFT_1477239 [Infundibulicybe gibba]
MPAGCQACPVLTQHCSLFVFTPTIVALIPQAPATLPRSMMLNATASSMNIGANSTTITTAHIHGDRNPIWEIDHGHMVAIAPAPSMACNYTCAAARRRPSENWSITFGHAQPC